MSVLKVNGVEFEELSALWLYRHAENPTSLAAAFDAFRTSGRDASGRPCFIAEQGDPGRAEHEFSKWLAGVSMTDLKVHLRALLQASGMPIEDVEDPTDAQPST